MSFGSNLYQVSKPQPAESEPLFATHNTYDMNDQCRPNQGLPTVLYFPGRPAFWPYCPASRPTGLPGTPNVPFFGRAQIVLKWCGKRMQDCNVLASKLKLGQLTLREIIKIHFCHQMSYFNTKMHQIRFRLALCPKTRWGSLQLSPRLLSWI